MLLLPTACCDNHKLAMFAYYASLRAGRALQPVGEFRCRLAADAARADRPTPGLALHLGIGIDLELTHARVLPMRADRLILGCG
jgi:hypothetical protein